MSESIKSSFFQEAQEVFFIDEVELSFALESGKDTEVSPKPLALNYEQSGVFKFPEVKIPFPNFLDFSPPEEDGDKKVHDAPDIGEQLNAIGKSFAKAIRDAKEEKEYAEKQAHEAGEEIDTAGSDQEHTYLLDPDARFNYKQNNTDQASWPYNRNSPEERKKFPALKGEWKYDRGDEDIARADGKWLEEKLKRFPNSEATFFQLEEAFVCGRFPDGTAMSYGDSVRLRQGSIAHFMQIAGVSGDSHQPQAKITIDDAKALQELKL